MDQIMGMVAGFVSAHPYWTVGIGIGWYLFSVATSVLPSPTTTSSGGYKFLFSFMHAVSGGLARLMPFLRLPSDPSRNSTPFYKNGGSNGGPPTPPLAG